MNINSRIQHLLIVNLLILIQFVSNSCKKVITEEPIESQQNEKRVEVDNATINTPQKKVNDITDIKVFFFNAVGGTSEEYKGYKKTGDTYQEIGFFTTKSIEFCQYDDTFDRIEVYGKGDNYIFTIENSKTGKIDSVYLHNFSERYTIVRDQLPTLTEEQITEEDIIFYIQVQRYEKVVFRGKMLQYAVCSDI